MKIPLPFISDTEFNTTELSGIITMLFSPVLAQELVNWFSKPLAYYMLFPTIILTWGIIKFILDKENEFKNIENDDTAETPIEIIFTVMATVLTMGLAVCCLSGLVDGLMDAISNLNIQLSPWGQTMMDNIPNRYSSMFYLVPIFFILLVMAWGVKKVIQRHKYTYEDEYMADEY